MHCLDLFSDALTNTLLESIQWYYDYKSWIDKDEFGIERGPFKVLPRIPPPQRETGKIILRTSIQTGHAVAWLVEALCYNPEGCGFESQCGGFFSVDLTLPAALWHLGLTQPLTEMSTSNFPGAKRAPGAWGWQTHRHMWADCLEKMCDPRRLTTLWTFTACYRDSFFLLPLPTFEHGSSRRDGTASDRAINAVGRNCFPTSNTERNKINNGLRKKILVQK
jgi:hypothetical protein